MGNLLGTAPSSAIFISVYEPAKKAIQVNAQVWCSPKGEVWKRECEDTAKSTSEAYLLMLTQAAQFGWRSQEEDGDDHVILASYFVALIQAARICQDLLTILALLAES